MTAKILKQHEINGSTIAGSGFALYANTENVDYETTWYIRNIGNQPILLDLYYKDGGASVDEVLYIGSFLNNQQFKTINLAVGASIQLDGIIVPHNSSITAPIQNNSDTFRYTVTGKAV